MNTLYKRSSLTQAVECEGEWVIIHVSHDTITKLNDTAGSLWAMLNKSMTVNQLVALASSHNMPLTEVAAADIEMLLEQLVHIGLVEKW
ncbi:MULTISPECIES: PqqD family protein [Paenibacillus]|jgi:hypothetical protein|uniref:PqqD family protein n=1 Tax=Paenibacillus baimaensis TaxID=2982185 RepID=A0ABT2UKM4_9BACL|nr:MULTISPECIES: PqqD family protein [unclassified Paenibacillus]MCU6794214.1 PqqD family protein [Paenibacillus sp. WQ 127069]OMF13554.1 hypothetical protein BK127_20155 [Paenibacillus sp. FSL H7-0331]